MDEQTVAKACRGSTQARDELIRELGDVWYRFCLSQTGDVELARDATQETALRFIEQLPRFQQRSSIKTWSLGIALNVVRELRRKNKRQSDDQLETVPDTGEDVTDQAGRIEQGEQLKKAMHLLSDRQREAVVLRFFENLSVEETARSMECATGTVKATIHQAMKILKDKLTPIFGTRQ